MWCWQRNEKGNRYAIYHIVLYNKIVLSGEKTPPWRRIFLWFQHSLSFLFSLKEGVGNKANKHLWKSLLRHKGPLKHRDLIVRVYNVSLLQHINIIPTVTDYAWKNFKTDSLWSIVFRDDQSLEGREKQGQEWFAASGLYRFSKYDT